MLLKDTKTKATYFIPMDLLVNQQILLIYLIFLHNEYIILKFNASLKYCVIVLS